MKNIILLSLAIFVLNANEITLTKQQITNWQIKTQIPTKSNTIPQGTYLMEVTTPPNLNQAITLTFEAQVRKIYVASYQNIKKGDLLIEVSGSSWIEAQNEAILDAIKLKQSRTIANQKNRLCKEEIIPQKECINAGAILKNDRAKLSASKAVLKAYGADAKLIKEIVNNLKIRQSLSIKSNATGVITELYAQVGKSIDASSPLLLIQENGAKWIESDIPNDDIDTLIGEKEVEIVIKNQTYLCKVLQFSPIINRHNQTRKVRFILPDNSKLLSGFRDLGQITIKKPSFTVDKHSVIKSGKKYIVFVETASGYKSVRVEILAEDEKVYYLAPNKLLETPIAISSLATLKSMLDE